MKLSVETYLLRNKYGDQKAFAMLHEAGFDAVDYSFYWHEDPWFMQEDSREQAALRRSWLEAEGLSCVQAHAPFDLLYGENWNEDEPHYRMVVRALECAAIMGAACIVVHALETPIRMPEEQVMQVNYEYYKTLQPYCEKFGIRIAVENLFLYDLKRKGTKGLLGSPKALCDMLHRLDSPWFTACVDVGHAAVNGYEPEDFLLAMEPELLGAVHIQDTDFLDDRHMLPFTQEHDWTAIMAALKQQKFCGPMNLEIISFMDRMPEALIPDALAFSAKVGRYLLAQLGE